jgi:hypothetical protein
MTNTPTASSPPAGTAPSPYVRHEVRSAQGQEALAAYATAVAAMKARPESDPTSWSYQAAMHGTARDGCCEFRRKRTTMCRISPSRASAWSLFISRSSAAVGRSDVLLVDAA